MRKSKKEPIPIHFETAENAGEFWDTHDLADYWDETRETDLTFNLQQTFLVYPERQKRIFKKGRVGKSKGIL